MSHLDYALLLLQFHHNLQISHLSRSFDHVLQLTYYCYYSYHSSYFSSSNWILQPSNHQYQNQKQQPSSIVLSSVDSISVYNCYSTILDSLILVYSLSFLKCKVKLFVLLIVTQLNYENVSHPLTMDLLPKDEKTYVPTIDVIDWEAFLLLIIVVRFFNPQIPYYF